MTREQTLKLLAEHKEEIRSFRVKRLALFGSVARDEAGPESDVDVLVDFETPVTFGLYMGLRIYLEDLLARRVDLVTRRGLRPRARAYVERDSVDVP